MKLVRNLSLALALFAAGAPNWAAQHDQHKAHHPNRQLDPWRLQMNHDHAHSKQPAQQPDQDSAPPFWRSRYAIGLLVFGAVSAYFLLSEHRAHFFGALPFLLLLACPLMHMFMHGGQGGRGGGHGGGHGDHGGGKQGASSPEAGPAPKTGAQP